MEKRFTKVEAWGEGRRLDLFLVEKWPDLTRSRSQKLIREKLVTVNGLAKQKNYRVKKNDTIALKIPAPEPLEALPQSIPLQVIYEDQYLIVINKPAGMVVHPAAGHREGTLVNALLAYCPDLKGINDKIRPGIVHRLDKDTSGLLVVAKEQNTMHFIAEELKKRRVKRTYLALAEGIFRKKKGTVDVLIGRHPKNRKKMSVVGQGRGRRAVTHYRVIKESERYSFVKLLLETGRTHQIRVSLAHLGHPVVNDAVYGRKEKTLNVKGQLLHAFKLVFPHPYFKEEMIFTAPLPDYFLGKLTELNCLPNCFQEKGEGFEI